MPQFTPLITSAIIGFAVFLAAAQVFGFVRFYWRRLDPFGINYERFWMFVDKQQVSVSLHRLLRGDVVEKYTATAGLAPIWKAERLIKFKKVLVLLASIFAIIWSVVYQDIFFAAGVLIVAYLAVDYYLGKLSARRKLFAVRTLPQIIDLLQLQAEVGLNLEVSFQNLARSQKGLWAKEFAKLSFELGSGIPLTNALERLSKRFDLDDLNRFAASVKQSKLLGATLTSTLAIQAETLRTRRRQKAEEKARLAALKISFPLVVFIFPALLIIYIAPAIIKVLELG